MGQTYGIQKLGLNNHHSAQRKKTDFLMGSKIGELHKKMVLLTFLFMQWLKLHTYKKIIISWNL